MGLIKKGLAYVCELTPEQFKEYRGDTNTPARSPWRDRPIEESLDLFERMKNGEFPEGKYTLRAKIDLESGNFNMRDPVLYRIRYIEHHRQGTKWCIFPMYDFAHPIQDAWRASPTPCAPWSMRTTGPVRLGDQHTDVPASPVEIEFAPPGHQLHRHEQAEAAQAGGGEVRLRLGRPPHAHLCGLRRRGYTARSIRNFCERIGVAKSPNTVEYGFLEHCLREDLNATAQRTMAVLHPVKLTVTNYPEGQSETFTVENNPTDPTQVPMRSPSAATCGSRRRIFWRCLFPSISACTPTARSAV